MPPKKRILPVEKDADVNNELPIKKPKKNDEKSKKKLKEIKEETQNQPSTSKSVSKDFETDDNKSKSRKKKKEVSVDIDEERDVVPKKKNDKKTKTNIKDGKDRESNDVPVVDLKKSKKSNPKTKISKNVEESYVENSIKNEVKTKTKPKKNKEELKDVVTIKSKKKVKSKISEEESSDLSNGGKVVKNQTETSWSASAFTCSEKNSEGKEANLKIITWNVDGLRAWVKKGGLQIIEYASPDILCLQETKCAEETIPEEISKLDNYFCYWCSSEKNGYAGVGLLSKKKPINVEYGIDCEEQDNDGRCITVEFKDYFVVTVYVPNAGKKLVTLDKRLQWNEEFKRFLKDLDQKKPVIVCGDMNVAHSEIDLRNPKTNTKNAGFTKEEREGMTDLLSTGFVDIFRSLYPDKTDSYTFWTYMMNARKKNIGWRLDYFIVSDRIKDKICDNLINDTVYGSDHCPTTLFLNI